MHSYPLPEAGASRLGRFWYQTASALLLLLPWQQLWHRCLNAIRIKQFGIVAVGTQIPSLKEEPLPSQAAPVSLLAILDAKCPLQAAGAALEFCWGFCSL